MSTLKMTSGQYSVEATGPAADRLTDALNAVCLGGVLIALLSE